MKRGSRSVPASPFSNPWQNLVPSACGWLSFAVWQSHGHPCSLLPRNHAARKRHQKQRKKRFPYIPVLFLEVFLTERSVWKGLRLLHSCIICTGQVREESLSCHLLKAPVHQYGLLVGHGGIYGTRWGARKSEKKAEREEQRGVLILEGELMCPEGTFFQNKSCDLCPCLQRSCQEVNPGRWSWGRHGDGFWAEHTLSLKTR